MADTAMRAVGEEITQTPVLNAAPVSMTCPNCAAVLSLKPTVIAAPRERPKRTAHGRFSLSERQAQVADLVADGFSNKQIATAVGITEQVAKNYLRCVFQKTGCSNRTELTKLLLLGRA